MPKPVLLNIDPEEIFLQARRFHLTNALLKNLAAGNDVIVSGELAQPQMVISALSSELYLKCLICLETGGTPKGHRLADLYGLLSADLKSRIQHLWDNEVVPLREPNWKIVEAHSLQRIARDLPTALQVANKAFERIRYSYEPARDKSQFYIDDLPTVLVKIILQVKPEWMKFEHQGEQISPGLWRGGPRRGSEK
jgi:hypothetical protein